MSMAFCIRIEFVEESPQIPNVLLVGGVVDGDLFNGAEGFLKIGDRELRLQVLDIAFLERPVVKNSIMFSVKRPEGIQNWDKWVGGVFRSEPSQ